MKILLIKPLNVEPEVYSMLGFTAATIGKSPPLGLMYLHSYLSPYHDVTIIDMDSKKLKNKSINSILNEHNPDIIGITCLISTWLSVIKLSEEIKQYNKNIKIVVGGVNPSIYTYETLQCKDIDYVIRGFGQAPMLELCNQLEQGRIGEIDNVFTRENYPNNILGTFIHEDIDKYPFPYRSKEDDTYLFTGMITTLGCTHRCHFCNTPKTIKMREVENVINELIEIEKIGISTVFIYDESFLMSKDRTHKFCSLIIEKGIKLKWMVKARIDQITEETLYAMKKAGCVCIHVGIESGTDRVLEKMNKKITTSQIKQIIKLIKKYKIACSASFILGYLTETKEEILETINFAAELDVQLYTFWIAFNIPDTDLYKEWQEKTGYEGDAYSKFILNPLNMESLENTASDIFTKKELDDFIKLAYSEVNKSNNNMKIII